MGLWYPKDSSFELTAFSDADHAGCIDSRKSTSGGIQFLGDKFVSWMSKKQNCTAMSSAEAEYVALSTSSITYNLDQTSRYSANYDQMTANKIDVTDEACEEYFQEVLGFSDVTASGSPTPSDDPIISTTSPTLTLFGDNDFLLFEEANGFLGLEDDPDSLELDPSYYVPEGDIQMLEAILNSDLVPSLPNHEQSVPSFTNELKGCEAKTIKSSVDEPPEVELKDLPPHLEYAFLECDNKLPVIIAKELGDEEKSTLIKVLKSHKRAIAWKLSDIQEVEKLLDAGLSYPISDSPWVIPVHCVPKKGGFTIVKNEENELIPTRLVTGWRVCIDYQKLNEATRKDHFPFPFMDQMLERLAGNEYYCFPDGFSGYFQIPIDPRDQEKTTFTCPYGTFAYRRMPFGLCNAPGTFQRCMLAIFHDMVEKTMEVFMDDFSVFGNSFETCLSRLDKMLQRLLIITAYVEVLACAAYLCVDCFIMTAYVEVSTAYVEVLWFSLILGGPHLFPLCNSSECLALTTIPTITQASKKRKKTAKAPIEQSNVDKEKADIRKWLHLLKEDVDDRLEAVKKGYYRRMVHEDCATPQFVTFKKEIFWDVDEFTLPINQQTSLNF
nr:reverse transcriptase domain-containing protein [Tanacetum cinerariifolium]